MTTNRDDVFLEIITQAAVGRDARNIIKSAWGLFQNTNIKQKDGEQNRNSNGRFFELLIQRILVQNELVPFYISAEIALVPNVNFDIIVYTKERGPICLSIKTSLRERYKQADLEAIALKQVHRKSKTFLLTISSTEASGVAKKINEGSVVGIDEVIDCTTGAINKLLDELKTYTIVEAGTISIIKRGKLVKN